MILLKKIRTYIRNKIYKYIFQLILAYVGKKKVRDFSSYKKIARDQSDTLHKIDFTEGFSLIVRGRDLSGVTESCILEDYTQDFKIEEGQIIYDLGSCTGDLSILAAFRGAKVFAFEPDISNFNILKKNIELNGMSDRITAYNVAVGPEVGTIGFDNLSPSSGGHSLSEDAAFKVPVTTLQQVMQENNHSQIDLLKIDIEGGEYSIFSNPETAQFQNIKTIVGEYHLDIHKPHYSADNIRKLLSKYYDHITFRIPYNFTATRKTDG